MLPANVHRCPGRPRVVAEGEWPFPRMEPDCLMQCARRTQGIADFMAGAKVEWFDQPPQGSPCPELLPRKQR